MQNKSNSQKHDANVLLEGPSRGLSPVTRGSRSDLMTNSHEILFMEICGRPTTGVFVAEQDLSSVANLKSAAGSSIVFEVQVERFQLRIN